MILLNYLLFKMYLIIIMMKILLIVTMVMLKLLQLHYQYYSKHIIFLYNI